MRFFPSSVKQPLLGIQIERKGKEKKKKKIESLGNSQISKKPVHIALKNIFIVSQRKASTGKQLQSSRTRISVNF